MQNCKNIWNGVSMLVISGDLGGTKTLLQIARFQCDANGQVSEYQVVTQRRYQSAEFKGLISMLTHFIQDSGLDDHLNHEGETISSACFAIAGPITNTNEHYQAHVTNLDWAIDSKEISQQLGISRVSLVNDFYAVASAVEILDSADLQSLQSGEPQIHGHRAILGAGTGLGIAFQIWNGEQYTVVPTEAGHTSFAPGSDIETELLIYLNHHTMKDSYDSISYENILSGSGLVKIYEFLVAKHGINQSLIDSSPEQDPAATISHYGLLKKDLIAEQALDIFVRIYGRQAGNLGLSCLANGGVYIAGGIGAKIKDKLADGQFIKAFKKNKMMQHLLEKMPVHLILNPDVGLIGAAYIAAQNTDE